MEERGSDVAAVIIEGIPANSGLLVQRPEFVNLLRSECTRYGALLILDEVITGFRIGTNGAAGFYGIEPDIATYGKVIGGGMPVGAYGASRDLMERLAPLGPVYQAGTLSGNPVAMAAGSATLGLLLAEGGAAFNQLEELGSVFSEGLATTFKDHGLPWSVERVGSILWLVLQEGQRPRSFEAIQPETADVYARLHSALHHRGISLAPSAYEVMFVSLAHDRSVIEETVAAFGDALAEIS
jgi:glutamate-1-semialdehyde 2,1-aminomutase